EHGGNYTGNAHEYVDVAIPRVLRMGVMQHLLGTSFDWSRDTPSNEGWCLGLFTPGKSGMLLGRKGADDASYQRHAHPSPLLHRDVPHRDFLRSRMPRAHGCAGAAP
ncbi:MAG: hypothetical protein ACRECQ_10455, partial [Burkholderiaceae bacterium]